jgi:hypothetical protein
MFKKELEVSKKENAMERQMFKTELEVWKKEGAMEREATNEKNEAPG